MSAEPVEGPNLVTLIVGDTGRAGNRRTGTARKGGTALKAAAAPPTEVAPGTGVEQWSCRWSPEGPGPLSRGCEGEPDLTLALSTGDAQLVRQGQLEPSVAFMQGRLKTSGDNGLLLRVLAWSATPAFTEALRR